MSHFDVAVIGAGPAGMAAATETAAAGLSTVVLDEQEGPGGQIYRGVEKADARRLKILGDDYASGRRLADEFRSSGAIYLPGATVWNVNRELAVDYSRSGGSTQLTASALVVASGAIERPTPMPGWTLPGVVTAGACQILLKAHGLATNDAVFVGCGPLLWLIAAQMTEAGVKPRAIVETVPRSRYGAALRKLPPSLSAVKYLRKGARMMRAVKRAGVPVHRDATDIAIVGMERAEAVTFRSGGRPHRIDTDVVALHQGVVPNQQITRVLRCEHRWSENQRCFVPVVDEFGETSVAGVYVAGDGSGIGGAAAATLRGRLVARRIAAKAGRGTSSSTAALVAELRREMAIRPFLETLYAPSEAVLSPSDTTLVCRCEEITAGQIREAVDLGAPGPNQVKSFLRSGMGPCQGRMCGLAVTEIIADRRGEPPSLVDYYRIRPPLKPLALSELAALRSDEPEPAATK